MDRRPLWVSMMLPRLFGSRVGLPDESWRDMLWSRGRRNMSDKGANVSAGKMGWVALTLCMLLCTALVGCGPASSSGGTTGGGFNATKSRGLALGTAADYNGVKISVISAHAGPQAIDGKRSFVVRVRYENGTKDTVSYSDFDWSVQDSKGVRKQGTAVFDTNPETLGSGDMAPGDSEEGDIYFSEGEDVAKVVYAPSMSAGEEDLARWAVK